jgi:hypothetical protein
MILPPYARIYSPCSNESHATSLGLTGANAGATIGGSGAGGGGGLCVPFLMSSMDGTAGAFGFGPPLNIVAGAMKLENLEVSLNCVVPFSDAFIFAPDTSFFPNTCMMTGSCSSSSR